MKQKVIDALRAFNDESDIREFEYTRKPFIHNGLSISHVKTHGGHEGSGEEHWIIVKAVDEQGKESHWKIPGYYQSYHGAELEISNTFEVVAKEQIVTVWEKK